MTHSKTARAGAGLTLALAVGLAACGSSPGSSSPGGSGAASAAPVNINVGYVAYADDAALFLGIQHGIFAKHGLNVTLTSQANPIDVVSSMVSGQEQFGFVTTPVLVNVNAKGTSLKCVSTVDGQQPTNPARDGTMLVAAKGSGITSLKDLAGKKIATVQLSSLNSLAVEVLAKRAGVSPGRYQMIAMPFPQMPAALSEGHVQAAVIVSPFVNTAIAQGATVIDHPNVVLFGGATVTCLSALGSYIGAHRATAAAFRAAMDQAVAYSKSHQSAAKATLAKYLSITSAVAQKQILSTNWNPAFNAASVNQIEADMMAFGLLKKAIPASSMLWSAGG
jgi:NitT/TauT family transport system substrate-binding protein